MKELLKKYKTLKKLTFAVESGVVSIAKAVSIHTGTSVQTSADISTRVFGVAIFARNGARISSIATALTCIDMLELAFMKMHCC